MAISPAVVYPTQTEAPSPQYPFGASQNVTTSGDNTGTPWEKLIIDDMLGFFQALLDSNADSPTGVPDQVGASQYLDAIVALSSPPPSTPAEVNGFNTSVARVKGGSLDVSGEIIVSVGVKALTTNNTVMVLGSNPREIFQYNNSACDFGTATYSGASLDVSSEETAPTAFNLNSTAERLVVVGTSADDIIQYNLPTSGSLAGASYSGLSFPTTVNPAAVCYGDNDTKIYTIGSTATIFQYNLSDPTDVSTAVQVGFAVILPSAFYRGMDFSLDGRSLSICTGNLKTMITFTLGVAWDISTLNTASAITYTFPLYFASLGVGAGFSYPDGRELSLVGTTTADVATNLTASTLALAC